MARFVLATAVAVLAPAARAHAQAVDYAALQDTLGEPVTTSVTGKPQRASLAPAAVEIITREQIARSPARSVPDLLKAYAGVDVNNWTAGQSDVAVRGGAQPYNARLLVLVNGRQVYLDHYGMTDWNLLGVPLEAIQQIELVRGPASALFGFNAASGVVNIVTIDPMQVRHADATAEIGTHGYSRLAAALGTPIGDKLGFRLSAEHRREDERSIPTPIGRPVEVQPVITDAVNSSLVVAPDAASRIELSGGYADNRQLEFLPTAVLLEQRFRSETAGLMVDHDTGWGSVNAQAYANWLDADYGVTGPPPGPFTQLADVRTHNRIVVAKGSSLVRISNADTLRLGGEYRNNQLFSDALYSPRIGYQVIAGDAMLDLHPRTRVAISLAARIDHLWLDQGGMPTTPVIDPVASYQRTFDRFSFNAAVLVQVGHSGQLRVNGGRGLQLPSLVDFGLRTQLPASASPIPVYATGDPRIKPATVWSAEVGYTQRLGPDLHVDADVFFNRTAEAIASPGDAPTYGVAFLPTFSLVTRFSNAGSFDAHGIAVAAGGHVARDLGWFANYTWTAINSALPDAGPPFAIALAPAATTPTHVANLGGDYSRGRWTGAIAARYTSATRQFAFTRTAQLQLFPVTEAVALDAKLGYRLTRRMSVYAAGTNLAGAGGAAGSPIPADRRVRIGAHMAL